MAFVTIARALVNAHDFLFDKSVASQATFDVSMRMQSNHFIEKLNRVFDLRFLAIWWPLKMQISKKRAKGMIVGIWFIALSITMPWALYFQLEPIYPEEKDNDESYCIEKWPNPISGNLYYLFANLLACYLIPMIMISVCYTLIWIKVISEDCKCRHIN